MGNAFWFSWEPKFLVFLQSFVTPFLQKVMEVITFFGDQYAMILIIGFLYWGYKKELGKKIGTFAITALMADVALNNLVMRRRPYFDHADVKCLKPRASGADPYDLQAQGYSFPSGHATNSVSVYGALGLNVKNVLLKVIYFLIPVIIAVSRLSLGVHYPTDILAGWALSVIIILGLSFIKNSYITYSIIAALGIAGCFFSKSDDYYSALGLAFGFIAAFIFEEKVVHFENTKNVFRMILRTIGGLIIFVVLDKALKMPFSANFLDCGSMLSFLVRSARYMICSFAVIGVYPMLFKVVDKKILKKE